MFASIDFTKCSLPYLLVNNIIMINVKLPNPNKLLFMNFYHGFLIYINKIANDFIAFIIFFLFLSLFFIWYIKKRLYILFLTLILKLHILNTTKRWESYRVEALWTFLFATFITTFIVLVVLLWGVCKWKLFIITVENVFRSFDIGELLF